MRKTAIAVFNHNSALCTLHSALFYTDKSKFEHLFMIPLFAEEIEDEVGVIAGDEGCAAFDGGIDSCFVANTRARPRLYTVGCHAFKFHLFRHINGRMD